MMVMNAQMEPVLATIRAQKGGDLTTSPSGSRILKSSKILQPCNANSQKNKIQTHVFFFYVCGECIFILYLFLDDDYIFA